MFYAYVLQSTSNPGQLYRGHTTDLKQRVADHNTGKCPHTSKFTPWRIKFYAAFETLELAQRFERYLKSGSGHAFAKKHFGL
jgi:putative endonuclease